MAQLQLVKHTSGYLIPATPATSDFLVSKCRPGTVLDAEVKQPRNPVFHRRFFALLNLGFAHWQPAALAVSPSERQLVNGYVEYLVIHGVDESALLTTADSYLSYLSDKRAASIQLCKSYDAFRAWVVVAAGHYDVIQLPDGTLRKYPRSISFASMSEAAFSELYRAVLDVLWRWIFSRNFRCRRDAENAALNLLSFAG